MLESLKPSVMDGLKKAARSRGNYALFKYIQHILKWCDLLEV